jgi:predicted RNA methylase
MTAHQNKYLYTYDFDTDQVVNQRINNHVFGTPSYSYQKQYRPNGGAVRAARFREKDIVGQTILDLGCNEGEILLACHQIGAKEGFGVDYSSWCICQGRASANTLGVDNVHFMVGDMENRAVWQLLHPADTVLLLAILESSTFAHQFAVVANADRLAKKVMYYEGHQGKESAVRWIYQLLVWTSFTRFEYLGKFEERILIRCSRELMLPHEVPPGAVTSDASDETMREAEEIYVFTDTDRNPVFGPRCRLIQYIESFRHPSSWHLLDALRTDMCVGDHEH